MYYFHKLNNSMNKTLHKKSLLKYKCMELTSTFEV